jgi:hypothetical protein
LAKKLEQCGVFGVSHHEFLHNAQENKNEWVKKGEEVTAKMLALCQAKYGSTKVQKEEEAILEQSYGTLNSSRANLPSDAETQEQTVFQQSTWSL